MADNTGTGGNDNGLPVVSDDGGNGLTIENGTLQRDTSAGTPAFRILEIAAGADVTIDRVSITGGLAADTGNGFGGGILNHGTLSLNRSTVHDNAAATAGISFGGGILNSVSGTLTVTNSTISQNQATLGSVIGGGTGSGGGIHSVGTLAVTNSTISGNKASSGGGVNSVGSATLNNSIITNSTHGDCGGTGTFTGSNNLIDDVTCGASVGSLGPVTHFDTNLSDNGGSTLTHALLLGSNAIDAGDNSLDNDANGNQLSTDGRGAGLRSRARKRRHGYGDG